MNNNIACLLPLYINDNAHYLKLAIESLVNQPCKLILLCDGPIKDEHEKILQQYNSKIEILRFSANRGLAAVLNDGIRYALENGFEFIARMDADDIALPDRIASQYTFLTANPQIDVVGGAIEEIDENSLPTGKIVSYPLTHEACFKFFSARDPLAHPAV
ncbi:MAG: glycosyltransferase, partial [Bacteroidales bacterium]|nr:glycosyltransferase [Bacteroidales bacterium]